MEKKTMTSVTAEEILDNIDCEPLQTGEFYYRSEVLKAMTDFAAHQVAEATKELLKQQDKLQKQLNDAIATLRAMWGITV
jgi:hypothetical protein